VRVVGSGGIGDGWVVVNGDRRGFCDRSNTKERKKERKKEGNVEDREKGEIERKGEEREGREKGGRVLRVWFRSGSGPESPGSGSGRVTRIWIGFILVLVI
jgi:hypothetical protein